MAEERPQRFCESCKKVDDHPRHAKDGKYRHLDCCAAEGCEVCIATEKEYGERRGQELIDHLESVRNDG